MNIVQETYNWAYPLTPRSKRITRIILHHAAATTCTAQQIHSWHIANGWAGIGYHYFVRKDGTIYKGRPDDMVGAHAGNNNSDSIGICFEGNFDKEQMNDTQKEIGRQLVAELKEKYSIEKIQKHSDVNATGCPGKNFPFDYIAGQPTARCALNIRQLEEGMSGEDVKSLQGALNGRGYVCGNVDGIFGQRTKTAVKNYQDKQGLASDGIVGPNTWKKLLEV